jgi:hypothetical protein
VEVLDDAHRAAGFRAVVKIGTQIPGVAAVGVAQGRTGDGSSPSTTAHLAGCA